MFKSLLSFSDNDDKNNYYYKVSYLIANVKSMPPSLPLCSGYTYMLLYFKQNTQIFLNMLEPFAAAKLTSKTTL